MADKEQYHLSKPAEWIDKVVAGAVIGTEPMPELSDQFKAQFRENIGAADATAKWQPLGFFDTVEELKATITNPAPGDAYAVGAEEPFNIWVWDGLNKRWRNGGNMKGMDGAPGADGADGKDAVITPEQVEAGLGYNPGMVNPNLLYNWYFGNPVNQRGQTSYSKVEYTIDGWRIRNANGVVVSVADCLTIDMSGATGNSAFSQYIEFPELLYGKTVTISALTKEGKLVSSTATLPAQITANTNFAMAYFNDAETAYAYIRLYAEGTGLVDIYCQPAFTGTLQLIAVKLDLGAVQTLAHQDADGNWVLNDISDYGEQLARCQRYYHLYSNAAARPNNGLDCAPPMRLEAVSQGTIVINGKTYYYNSADL